MTHRTHSVEQMRIHADEVVRLNTNSLNTIEKTTVEEAYRDEIDSITNWASKEGNKLRLAIYAHLLDTDNTGYEINNTQWILDNVKATQVLINVLSDNALHYWVDSNGVKNDEGRGTLKTGEDGIYGPATMRCVLALFGLTVSVPAAPTPAPVVATVSGAVATSLRPEARPTTPEAIIASGNDAFTPEQMVNMRRTILSDPHLKGELEKIGVRFERNEDTGNLDMILPEGFETTPEYRQLQTYIRALHMTTDPEYTNPLTLTDEMRREKMEMYFELIRASGDHIQGREFLAYKLINSINEDLKMDPRGPYIMTRNGEQGEYGIFEFPITRDATNYTISSAAAPATLPYHEILAAGNIKDDYIDFATTYALVEGNHVAFQGREFLGQATLVNRILEKHGIKGVSEEDVQDGNLLIADWDVVKDQIDKKIIALSTGSAQNVEAYQELMYVKDLIEGKEWMAEGRTKDMFREINTFGRLFLEEKSLIDDTIARLNGSGTDETTGEMIRNIAAENLFGIPGLLALFIAIFNIGGLGKAAGIGLLGAAAAMAGGSIIDSVTDRTGDPLLGTNGGENLELVRIRQLQYGIKGGDAVNATLAKIYTENDRRLESSTTTATKLEFAQEPLVLGKILFEISESNELSTLDLADNDIATKIFNQMTTDGTLAVTGDEFTSNVSRNPTITQEDINAFVEILRTQTDTGLDTTLGDILVAGDIDKLNHNYDESWFGYTKNTTLSLEMHNVYRSAWNSGDREARKELLVLLESSDANLYNGTTTDSAADAWGAAPSISTAVRNVFTDATGVTLQQQLNKIEDLKDTISASNVAGKIDSSLATKISGILKRNQDFLTKENSFDKIRSAWYDDTATTRIDLKGWLSFTRLPSTSIPEQEIAYTAVRNNIANRITDLNALLGAPTGPEYSDLNKKINAEIQELTALDTATTQKLIELATDIVDGTGTATEKIDTDIGVGRVLRQTDILFGELNDSLDTGKTDLLGALNTSMRTNLENFYREAKNTGINGVNAATVNSTDIWNEMRDYVGSKILQAASIVPAVGGVNLQTLLEGISIGNIPPIGEVIDSGGNIDARAIKDIEAQIKLGLLQEYLDTYGEQIEELKQVKIAYDAELLALPAGTVLSPEQQRLKDMITSDYSAMMLRLQTELSGFIEVYRGDDIKTEITSLNPSSVDITEIKKFGGVADFLISFASIDGKIADLTTDANDLFGTSNRITAELVPFADLQRDYTIEKNALISNIQAHSITDETTIPASTANFVDIEKNIEVLKAVQGLTGGSGNSPDIDRAIGLWQVRKLEIATVNQIPNMRSAIDADIAQIDTDIAQLNTDLNALKLTPTPSTTTIAEIDATVLEIGEKTQLRAILKDAIDATPFTINTLQSALKNAYSHPTGARIAFTESYYQNSKNTFDTL